MKKEIKIKETKKIKGIKTKMKGKTKMKRDEDENENEMKGVKERE